MKSKVAEKMMASMPEDVKLFTDKYADLVVLINQLLRDKGYTQRSLALKLEKEPSEIHKWLSCEHNFTLRSICKLEAELGETLLMVPMRKQIFESNEHFVQTTYSWTVHRNVKKILDKTDKADKWDYSTTKLTFGNVG
jgi:hypothetical protein